jgi:hypothetical protein
MKYYALIIDTDQYSGNFEREMASYCTGLEFPRGEEYIMDDIQHADWWEEHVYLYSADSDDYPEGCSIWQTPGFYNNGMGWHYVDTPENRELAKVKCRESMVEYHARRKATVEERLRTGNFEEENGRGAWTKEACERTLKSIETSIANAGGFVMSPAYQSVAIFSDEQPPPEVIEEVKARAHNFNAVWQQKYAPWAQATPVTVTGFRMISIETATTETEIDVS